MTGMPADTPEMTADDVLEIVQLFDQNHIELYIDGGWGVDALLGEQTRPHADLDIAVQHQNVAQIRALLEARGYRDVPRDDTWECNFVLGDDRGHLVDIHSYTFDAAGNHVYGVAYPRDSLTGTGSVNGHPVKCISPEWMVKFHTGYKLDQDDYRDVKALCQRFGLQIPSEYEAFEREESDMANEDVFCLGIKTLIVNGKGEILLLLRTPSGTNESTMWDIPGGRKWRGEDIAATLRRELYEETGLQIGDKDVQFVGASLSSSRIRAGEIEAGLILFVYKCRWEGIPEVRLSPEHSDFWWATPEEARKALRYHISPGFIPTAEAG